MMKRMMAILLGLMILCTMGWTAVAEDYTDKVYVEAAGGFYMPISTNTWAYWYPAQLHGTTGVALTAGYGATQLIVEELGKTDEDMEGYTVDMMREDLRQEVERLKKENPDIDIRDSYVLEGLETTCYTMELGVPLDFEPIIGKFADNLLLDCVLFLGCHEQHIYSIKLISLEHLTNEQIDEVVDMVTSIDFD